MMWELASTGGPVASPASQLDGVDWNAPASVFVPIELGELAGTLQPAAIANGVVPRFDDPFTTYRIAGAEVTIYASNYDGVMVRGGELHPELRAWLTARYGIHRYSDPQWKKLAT